MSSGLVHACLNYSKGVAEFDPLPEPPSQIRHLGLPATMPPAPESQAYIVRKICTYDYTHGRSEADMTAGEWAEEHPHIFLVGGITVAFTALAPILVPLILNAMGFGAGGVLAGSMAASIHAAIGNVAAGSLFATSQAIGAGGALPLAGWLAGAGLGLATGIIPDIVWRVHNILFRQIQDELASRSGANGWHWGVVHTERGFP
jgi:hypothetical protein